MAGPVLGEWVLLQMNSLFISTKEVLQGFCSQKLYCSSSQIQSLLSWCHAPLWHPATTLPCFASVSPLSALWLVQVGTHHRVQAPSPLTLLFKSWADFKRTLSVCLLPFLSRPGAAASHRDSVTN